MKSSTDSPTAPPRRLLTKKTNKQLKLTVDDDNLHHGDGEEGQRLQRNFDKDSSDDEDDHDDEQTAHHTQTLRNTDTGGRSSTIS